MIFFAFTYFLIQIKFYQLIYLWIDICVYKELCFSSVPFFSLSYFKHLNNSIFSIYSFIYSCMQIKQMDRFNAQYFWVIVMEIAYTKGRQEIKINFKFNWLPSFCFLVHFSKEKTLLSWFCPFVRPSHISANNELIKKIFSNMVGIKT